MRRDNPLVSVLIPSYNHERYIEQAIRSIWDQTYRNIEIIIVDDQSSDGSVNLLEKLREESPFPMYVVVNENRLGPAKAINRAISLSRGDLVAMTASDDFFATDRFEWQVDRFKQDPGLMVHFANGHVFSDGEIKGVVHREKAERLLAKPCEEILEYLYINTGPLFLQTVLMRKEVLEAIGGFDEKVLADDWVMNIRIFQFLKHQGGRFAYENKPAFFYRKHGENSYKNFRRQSRLKLEVIEKYTPCDLKKKAISNIVFPLSVSALKHREFKESFRFWIMSQRSRFSFRQNARYIRKLVSAAIKTTFSPQQS